MTSWSSTAQPYPPRDRSHSPSRGAYGRAPLPETGYPEGYRADWDPYDRERWGYERGFEGRRSPEDEVGRKRRRSTSPYDRGDRYDPRPRYNDDYDAHSRGYGYGSPPRRGGGYPGRRAPVDPWTLDYPATLKQYADWFRYFFPQEATEEDNADKAATQEAGDGSKPRNGIKSRWEKYKKEYAQKQLQTMFEHHRKSPWFAEKYDPSPEFEQLRKRIRKEGMRGRIDIFLNDLDAGTYDPNHNKTETENESASKEDTNATETSDPNENPADTKDDSKPSGDDDMQFNMDAEEEANDPDSNRAEANGKGSDARRNKDDNRGEEVSVMPETNTVMIRTIPPDIGRVKLEQSCSIIPGFMYLALGEPLQKRNYYRAGWIRFKEDADMPTVMTELAERKIEGFKLHVTHALRPFVNRARYTPEVASRPDRLLKDLANAKALAIKFEEEAATLRVTKLTKPKGEIAEGDETKADGDTDTLMDDAQDEEEELEPRQSGVFAIEQRVEKILDELRENGASADVLEEKKTVIALDLYIAYLRAAFHTCYYCSIVTNHLEELQRRCVRHGRKPLTKSMLEDIKAAASPEREDKAMKDMEDGGDVKDDKDESSKDEKDKGNVEKRASEKRDWKRNDERWLEWLDSKIALLLDRDSVDPREYGGKVYEDELSKAIEPFIKQEDEGKFRCKTCQKLFKATSFVEKHIANKHPELVKPLEDITYFNNFVLDPHHVQPLSHPPNTVGQSAPPQAYGLQAPPPGQFGPDFRGFERGYPPPYPYGNYWDPYAHGAYPHPAGYPPYPPPPRDDRGRRLSDRVGGFAPIPESTGLPPAPGLPPKPATLDSALVAGNGGARRGATKAASGPLPPPPDAKEDPRAAKRVSYHDMDLVAEGDVELQY